MNPLKRLPHFERVHSRRDFLVRGGAGFGAVALTYLLESERLLAAPLSSSSAKPGDFPAKAKSVIFLFMEGGPSHLDTFDPKPKLREMAGQKLPDSLSKNLITAMTRWSRRCWPIGASGSNMGKAAFGFPTGCPTSPDAWMIWPSFVPAGATA